MIAAHLEPKGLSPDAKSIGAFFADAAHRENAERGSRMLRDAILLAKGIAPPSFKEDPRPLPVSHVEARMPHLCPMCRGPIKPSYQFVAHIQAVVAAYYGLHPNAMTSTDRRQKVTQPRQLAMYLALELTGKSHAEIGRRFGNRDHTTVIHARKAIEARMFTDAEVLMDVEVLKERLGG